MHTGGSYELSKWKRIRENENEARKSSWISCAVSQRNSFGEISIWNLSTVCHLSKRARIEVQRTGETCWCWRKPDEQSSSLSTREILNRQTDWDAFKNLSETSPNVEGFLKKKSLSRFILNNQVSRKISSIPNMQCRMNHRLEPLICRLMSTLIDLEAMFKFVDRKKRHDQFLDRRQTNGN